MRIFLINICIIIFPILISAQTKNLNYYFEQAKSNSPLINRSRNSSKNIQLNLQIVRSILTKPTVDIEANLLFSPIINHDSENYRLQWITKGADSYSGYDLSYSDGGQYQAVISIKQPLFMGSSYNAYLKEYEIANQQNDNSIELTEHELERLVSHQYILCLVAKQQREISKSLVEELNKQVKTMQKLVENAIYKQTDLMILQIETNNYKIEYKKLMAKYMNCISDLNLLCGINDTSTVNIADTNLRLKHDMLGSSKFMRRFTLDSLNVRARQVIFEQKYKPKLSLFADAGINAIYIPSFNRFGFATGLNFSWNIFDGHQKKFQYDKSIIEMQTIEFEKQNFATLYNIHKEKYLIQIKAVDEQIIIVQNQLSEYKKLLELYTFELSQAQVSIMDFKNLIKDISKKRQENILLKMQKQELINAYNYWNY